MRAEVVTIGTEILLGQIVDTNATKLALALKNIGLDLYYKTTVGDNEARIVEVLNNALNRADVVITTGGLGPTVDDMTRSAVAAATGRALVYSSALEAEIAERFRSFGRTMAENNKRQAYIPEGAQPLTNPVGSAPCFLSEDKAGRGAIISLPGVPRELEYMLEQTVIPLLIERMGGAKILKTRVLRTCAVGESNIDNGIGDLMRSHNPTVGLAAHAGQTDVRIAVKANSEAEADALIAPLEAKLRQRLGVAIYGVEQESVPEVVGHLLAEAELTLGLVDLVTGGLIQHDLTEAGFGEQIAAYHQADTLEPVKQALGVTADGSPDELTRQLVTAVTPASGVGLALVGPHGDGSVLIGVRGVDGSVLIRPTHRYQATAYRQRWLMIQGLDWLRRTLLGQLTSPVDWVEAD